jgi:hypothetical protein
LSYEPLKYGFVRIPSKFANQLPQGQPTRIKAKIDGRNEISTLRYRPEDNRLSGLADWYRENDVGERDFIRIEERQDGVYDLTIVHEEDVPIGQLPTSKKALREKALYESIQALFEKKFRRFSPTIVITALGGEMSSTMAEVLDPRARDFIRKERQTPDLMGFVVQSESQFGLGVLSEKVRNRIVIEVKRTSPRVPDLYQAKRYGEVFNAKYAYLVSPEPLSPEIREFIVNRRTVSRYRYVTDEGQVIERDVIFVQSKVSEEKLEFPRFHD